MHLCPVRDNSRSFYHHRALARIGEDTLFNRNDASAALELKAREQQDDRSLEIVPGISRRRYGGVTVPAVPCSFFNADPSTESVLSALAPRLGAAPVSSSSTQRPPK